MKKLIVTIIFLASPIGMVAVAAPFAPATKDVVINLSEVYVPDSINAQSEAYVVISGYFPNSCYRWSHPEVVNVSPTEHEIKVVAKVAQGMCMMVIVPYQKEVVLGHFVSGQHTLRFINGDGTYFEKTMKVD